MAKTIDLRTYLLLERAFVRRLQRSWRQRSAPLYAKITQACLDHKWDEARRLVPDLDLAEVGTENREWITYMLLSCAVFGAGIVAKKKPSFVGVGSFDTFLKQVTNNFLQYLELNATAQVQAEALQSIAEDEAKTKALKWEEAKHPRKAKGGPKGGEFAGKTKITESYDGYQHTLTMTDLDGNVLGSAKLRYSPRNRLADYDILHISPEARGRGYGEYLYRAVADKAKALGATHILGDVTSAGVLKLGIKVLGQPELVADAINELTVDEAMKRLEPLAPENAEGIIDTANYLAVRWPLTKKKYARKADVILKWEEILHPRDKEGQFTESGLPAGYTSRTESTGAYSGQTNFTTRVFDAGGQQVGYADYVVFEEHHDVMDRKLHPHESRPVVSGRGGVYRPEVTLSMIEVQPEHRRKGLGTAMLRTIAREHKLPINSGMRTEEGGALWKKWLVRVERLKWEEAQHPRDKEGQFTASGAGGATTYPIEGGHGPARARWEKLSKTSIEAFETYQDAKDAHRDLTTRLEHKYGGKGALEYDAEDYAAYRNSQAALQVADTAMERADAALRRQEPAMRREVVRNLATDVAEKMSVDPSIIDVVHQDPREFDVGNKHFTEAGHFNPVTGRVQLNAQTLSYGNAPVVKGIVGHELSHVMYHSLKKAADSEFRHYLEKAVTPDGQHHTAWYHERFGGQVGDVVIHSERKLKPEYQEEMTKEFPASTVMASLSGGELFSGISEKMVQENGHSEYAKSYWSKEAVKQHGNHYESAINETLAEVTRYLTAPSTWHAPDQPPHPTSPWVKLTRGMHEWYADRQEQITVERMRLAAEHNKTLKELEKQWAKEDA